METVGCLVEERQGRWMLARATGPVPADGQATDSVAVGKAARAQPGGENFQLVGLSAFKPQKHRGEKVAVRGVLLSGSERRLNVTSLQMTAGTCGK